MEFWRVTYNIAIQLAPEIISKWLRSSIFHIYHWISDSNLTWKLSVIIDYPFLFCYFLHDSSSLASPIIVRSVDHQRQWIYWSFIRVDAGLWPRTWSIRVVFVVTPLLRISHSRGFSWHILCMLLVYLPHPHHWDVQLLWFPSYCLFGCRFLHLVSSCLTP